MATESFFEVFKQPPSAEQAEALDWLNQNSGYSRVGFTKLWRRSGFYGLGSRDLVDFRQVALYNRGEPHQVKAIEYFDEYCPRDIREEFFRRWNAATPNNKGNSNNKKLTEADIITAAKKLNVTPAHIKAIIEVECRGSGFDDRGRPVILFEATYFSYHTKSKFDHSHPHLSSKHWNPNLYTTDEWSRLNQALRLDPVAAYMSCSWGIGQVMGEHYKLLGYLTIDKFVAAMHESEAKQLDAMLKYIQATNLDGAIRNNDWRAFAFGYNGEGYEKNNYHLKLEQAFNKFKSTPKTKP